MERVGTERLGETITHEVVHHMQYRLFPHITHRETRYTIDAEIERLTGIKRMDAEKREIQKGLQLLIEGDAAHITARTGWESFQERYRSRFALWVDRHMDHQIPDQVYTTGRHFVEDITALYGRTGVNRIYRYSPEMILGYTQRWFTNEQKKKKWDVATFHKALEAYVIMDGAISWIKRRLER